MQYTVPGSTWKFFKKQREKERGRELRVLKFCGREHYLYNQFFRVEYEKCYSIDKEHQGYFSNIPEKVILQTNPLLSPK